MEIDDLYVLEEAEEANVAGRFVQARRVEEKVVGAQVLGGQMRSGEWG